MWAGPRTSEAISLAVCLVGRRGDKSIFVATFTFLARRNVLPFPINQVTFKQNTNIFAVYGKISLEDTIFLPIFSHTWLSLTFSQFFLSKNGNNQYIHLKSLQLQLEPFNTT